MIAPTLIGFLLARIAEDEAGNGCNGEGEYATCWRRSERIDAECKAKRRIVERASSRSQWRDGERVAWDHAHLRDLATVYSDHPDYTEEWKP